MSAIPVVTFGLVIGFAVITLVVKRERVTPEEMKDALAGLVGMTLGMLPTMGLVAGYRQLGELIRMPRGGGRVSGEKTKKLIVMLIPPLMRVVVSLALAAAGLWIVLSHTFTAQEKHWGFTTLGTILGYWLKH